MSEADTRNDTKLNILRAKYPEFFSERNIGFHCGDGWVPIIEQACRLVKGRITNIWCNLAEPDQATRAICDRLPAELVEFQFDQIKEKFGTLRLYYHVRTKDYDILPNKEKFSESNYKRRIEGLHDSIGGVIAMAEAMSGITCEVSGYPGELYTHRQTGWMKTLSPMEATGYKKYNDTGEEPAETEK